MSDEKPPRYDTVDRIFIFMTIAGCLLIALIACAIFLAWLAGWGKGWDNWDHQESQAFTSSGASDVI